MRRLGVLLSTTIVAIVLAVVAAPVVLASPAPIGLTSSAPSVLGDGTGTVTSTATANVVNAMVTGEQVTQYFDPGALQLTGAGGVSAPTGWTLQYSTDGSTFGAAPGSPAGWAAVRGVRASGPFASTGAFGGQQSLTSQGTASEPGGGYINGTNVSGDSWTVFTSPTRVFTMWHHNGTNNLNQGAFDCFNRDGTHCAGFPFMLTPLETGTRAQGWYDQAHDHIWGVVSLPNGAGAGPGFVCVDVSGATPQYCGGSRTTAFISTGTVAPGASYSGIGCGATQGAALNCANDFAQVGGKLYAWEAATGKLMCVDTQAASGAGAACSGQPYAFAGVGAAPTIVNSGVSDRRTGLNAIGDKVYGAATSTTSSTGPSVAVCFDPATATTCTGWPKTLGALQPWIYEQVNASGTSQGVCFRNLTASSSGAVASCYQPDGTAFGSGAAPTVNTALRDALFIAGRTYGWIIAKNPVRVGTKYIWGNTSWQAGNNGGSASRLLNCYDVATSAACTGWPVTGVLNYSMSADEYNDGCVWKATDDGSLQAYNVNTGANSCPPPPTVSVKVAALLPGLACNGGAGISGWQSLSVSGPTYTSASLTVRKADGSVVTSGGTTWQNIAFSSGSVSLLSLAVADSGTNGTFDITFVGRTSTPVVTTLTATGTTPELCLSLHAPVACPAAPAQVPPGPLPTPAPAVVSADGEATLSPSGSEAMTTSTVSITRTAPADTACLGTITGQTTIDGTSTPVPNVPMTLVDGSGNVIATTTTDGSGNYSFDRLVAGNGYKVQFGTASDVTITAPTDTSAQTPRTVVVAQTTVVNGQYTSTPGGGGATDSGSPATPAAPSGSGQSATGAVAPSATPAPDLHIRTTVSDPVLHPGEKTTIKLVVSNSGKATATDTTTRAQVPPGFVVVDPRGGHVVGGRTIVFRTGSIAPGRKVTRTYVVVPTRNAVGTAPRVMGRSKATNTRAVTDPTAIRVIAPAASSKAAPVTG